MGIKADANGNIKGRAADGTPIAGKIIGKSKAAMIREAAEKRRAEEAAQKQKLEIEAQKIGRKEQERKKKRGK